MRDSIYFKTSYVDIKQILIMKSLINLLYFKTSYVDIKRMAMGTTTVSRTGFQNIIC